MSTRKASQSNRFRIIAGSYRHRVLPFPDAEGLRPTPDRIRETLFNWLQPSLAGARCLDLFTGSGALGLEALSRGAASVTGIDLSPAVSNCLAENVARLDETRFSFYLADAEKWLTTYDGPAFDMIFLDPPYDLQILEKVLGSIHARQVLAADGLLYLEDRKPLEQLSLPAGFELIRRKKAGQVHYGLCRYSP